LLPDDVIEVAPQSIRYKLSTDLDLGGVRPGDWDMTRRVPIERTDKHRSCIERYCHGIPWLETELFRYRYTQQFAAGEHVKGCQDIQELAALYERQFDGLYKSLMTLGFRDRLNGKWVKLPKVHIARDGEVILGNQGNHRLVMAKIQGIPTIRVRIATIHADFSGKKGFSVVELGPKLPECAKEIPAMTTLDERLAYYRITKEQIKKGAVIELGAWLGASTAFIAAGIRDSGSDHKALVYDRFRWDPSHEKKGATSKDMRAQFDSYMGELLQYVEVHPGELSDLRWGNAPIGFVVFDAPKRVREISKVLTAIHQGVREGTILAWQDFAYFPSYDIAACMARIGDNLEFIETVSPGTTVILRVRKPWLAEQVTRDAFALEDWSALDIEKHWKTWAYRMPRDMYARFSCGAAMFLCDNGHVGKAKNHLTAIIERYPEEVISKWKGLSEERQDFVKRYAPLFDMLRSMGAI